MCGLVGVIGRITSPEKDVFKTLLKFDTIRGPHSTGICRVMDNGDIDLVKDVGTPWELFDNQADHIYGKTGHQIHGSVKALIGHNRWATVGKINAENAHPFWQGDIVGAHNGTLSQWEWKRLRDSEAFQTDSETIMHNFNAYGLEETMKILGGAYALTWWNRAEESFNIIRNKERPLFYTKNTFGDVGFYASEAWMLEQALARHNIKHGDIYTVSVDTHYKIDMKEINGFRVDQRITRTPMQGYKYVAPAREDNKGTNFFTAHNKAGGSGTKGNVVHLGNVFGRGSVTPSVGELVEFVSISEEQDRQGIDYIYCHLCKDGPPIRVYYGNTKSDIYKLLDNALFQTYSGTVRKIKGNGKSTYLLLDNRSIKGITWEDKHKAQAPEEGPEDLFKDITKEAWDRGVEHGCAWCTYVPEYVEKGGVKFLNDAGEFLCAECASNENTVDYMQLVLKGF